VDVSDTTGIVYECVGDDPNGTVASYEWTLTKPGGSTVTKTTASATFSLTDINYAGTYQAVCVVTDSVGNTATSSTYEFSAHLTSLGGGTSGGGSSGGTAATTTLSVDHDLTTSGEEATIEKKQGAIVTFTLDGSNEHKITFKQVAEDTVTLIIESDPIEVTLKVGESTEVDVDGDGTNDLKVTLTAIEDGMAKVTTEKIAETTEPAPIVDGDGATTTTIAGAETTTLPTPPSGEPEGKRSLIWLWIVIIVIIIVIIVIATKKKGQK